MALARRFLPSIAVLSAFEAAARLGSFTLAARELALTQGAVSRQIKALEDQVDTQLFDRVGRNVRLTAAGETYLKDIGDALGVIAQATLGLRANPGGGVLHLAILPTFGTRWLAPRLPEFHLRHPGITLNLTTRLRPFDLVTERQDAAIHFGHPHWPGAETAFLLGETVIPACAPAMLTTHPVHVPADLRTLPLLHLATRPDAWARWFAAHDTDSTNPPGMVFDQFATAAQAAAYGLGVALLPRFLIARELADGVLVPALERPLRNDEAYYLAWPASRRSFPPLAAFRDWIVAEAARHREPDSARRGIAAA